MYIFREYVKSDESRIKWILSEQYSGTDYKAPLDSVQWDGLQSSTGQCQMGQILKLQLLL